MISCTNVNSMEQDELAKLLGPRNPDDGAAFIYEDDTHVPDEDLLPPGFDDDDDDYAESEDERSQDSFDSLDRQAEMII